MSIRKEGLATGSYYHVFSRSIAKYVIFNNVEDYSRFLELLDLCRFRNFEYKYSKFIVLGKEHQAAIVNELKDNNDLLVEIIAYCIMPTHIHLLLKQVLDKGIELYISRILNSYSKYFNSKYNRKGPLWEGRFKNVLVDNDNQLLHLSRYIHLNPSSADIIQNPFDWRYSSLNEYMDKRTQDQICNFKEIIQLSAKQYDKFVTDHQDYQRSISLIKYALIENYTG